MAGEHLIWFTTRFIMDRFRPGWRQRQARRKSPWHLLKLLLLFPLIGFSGYLLMQLMWQIHVIAYPAHAGRFAAFLHEHQNSTLSVARALILFPPFLPAIGIGALITNLLLWCIPPARRAFEAEAMIPPEADEYDYEPDDDEEMPPEGEGAAILSGIPPEPVADPEMKFREGSLKLLRITSKYLLPIGLGLALIGALIPFELQ